MRIGNRLFPYPLLNHEKLYSHYKDKIFNLVYSDCVSEDKQTFILDRIHIETDSETILELIELGIAKAVCTIECAQTMFRKTYNISTQPTVISIPLKDLSGKIEIKAFVIVQEDVDNYASHEFLDDYKEYVFSLEKNDIIAVDDGYITKIEFDEDEDTKKTSIFEIIRDTNIKDETSFVDYDSSLIYIHLPDKQFSVYESTKFNKKLENLYFSILAIPALSYCIIKVQKENNSVDVLRMDYKWFNSFATQYEKVHNGELLDDNNFLKIDVNKEAQLMLNTPITKSIDDIFDLVFNPNAGGSEND